MSRMSLGSVRLHDLLEASDDEYGFSRNSQPRVESALECREQEETQTTREHRKKGAKSNKGSDSEHHSIGTNEEKDQSKIGVFFDKAKKKTQKLVTRKKSSSESAPAATTCDTLSISGSAKSLDSTSGQISPDEISRKSMDFVGNEQKMERKQPLLIDPADASDPFLIQSLIHKCRVLPFFRARIAIFGSLVALTLTYPVFLTGFFWGIYITIIGFLYFFVSEPKSKENFLENSDLDEVLEAAAAAEDPTSSTPPKNHGFGLSDGVIYKGWMNELRTRYSPQDYHVNSATSVLVRLEGSMLRICRPAKAVLKHAFYDDPTLKSSQHSMVSQVIYDLKDAKVSLRPKRLARRRWWSRKYPIYIRFAHSSSSLVEIGAKNQGMARSASMAPNPQISNDFDDFSTDGYSPETDSDSPENLAENPRKMVRACSTSDIGTIKHGNPRKVAKNRGKSIFLFVRAAREKERWFHLLREACAQAKSPQNPKFPHSKSSNSLPDDIKPDDLSICTSVAIEAAIADSPDFSDAIFNTPEKTRKVPRGSARNAEFLKYQMNYAGFVREIGTIFGPKIPERPEKGQTISLDLGNMKWRAESGAEHAETSSLVDSLNILATRIFFDFCRDEFWVRQVKQKIQGKLATIHLPYFIEKLELGELKFGTKAPQFTAVYTPKIDEWGTWVDFEMKYKGGIRLVLQTSVNLLKLKSGAMQVKKTRVEKWTEEVTRYSDSSLPESPESSPDEDFGSKNHQDGNQKERTGKKILSIVERAAQSAFFQKAVKLQAVAKLIEDVSTTPLMLNVEVEELEGPMTCNIPPPPSDRLWYAFRRAPIFKIRAIPQVGDRNIDLSTVSEWIETKLRQVLEKNLVCPNMDDIILPVLSGNQLLHMGYNK